MHLELQNIDSISGFFLMITGPILISAAFPYWSQIIV